MVGAISPGRMRSRVRGEAFRMVPGGIVICPKEQVSNGLKIVIGVAVLNWTSLTTLRIGALVGVSPLLGVMSQSCVVFGGACWILDH